MVVKIISYKYPPSWELASDECHDFGGKKLGSIQTPKKGAKFFNIFRVDSYSLIKLSGNWNVMWSNIISGTSGIEIVSYPECGYIIIL